MHTMIQSPVLFVSYREDTGISCLAITSRGRLARTFAGCRSSFRYAALAATALFLEATGASATTLQTSFAANDSYTGEVFQIDALTGMTITGFGINAPVNGELHPSRYTRTSVR
jgi:hypothetical protein